MNEFYLPVIFDEEYLNDFVDEFFGDRVNKRILKEGILLLLDYCSQKYLSRESEGYGISLNSKRLLRGMINHRHAKRVIQGLRKRRILKLRRDYFAGHHSRNYEFGEWVLNGGFVKHSQLAIKRRSFYARGDRYDSQQLLTDPNTLIRYTTANLFKLETPDPNQVEFGRLSEPEKCSRRYALERFQDRRIYCFLDTFGRLHSNFTNLPKDLRVLTLLEGKPIYYLDIKSCFPTLLWTFVENAHERVKYRDWIYSGQFYENLMRRVGLELEFRTTFKKEFNAWINGGNQRDVYHAMRAEFPMLFARICMMKQTEYRRVGYSLMQLEATIMLRTALTGFWEKCPGAFAIPLHDAVYTAERSCECLEYLIKTSFETHIGIIPCVETVLNVPGQKLLPLAA